MKIKKYGANNVVIRCSILKRVLLFFYWPIYRFLINFKRSKNKNFKYNVSLCLIFKDEANFLKEWIEYHRLIGIEHFYLYNNNSTDNYKDELREYVDSGLITLIEFPYKYAQIKAYEDCYNRAKDESKWIGFIDADEFINIKCKDSIVTFLDDYEDYPSVYFNWRMFGTSGNIHEKKGLITEYYTQAWNHLSMHGKTFINNCFETFSIDSVHYMNLYCGPFPIPPIALNKSIVYNFNNTISAGIGDKGYINHYWSRSYNSYIFKAFNKGDACSSSGEKTRQTQDYFKSFELKNITKDYSIQRWLVFLKLKCKNNS